MSQVTLNGITKRYEDVLAVENMNLNIADGEFVTLVGPSGCGKSTTMECIAGLTNPSEGMVQIGDKDVTDLPPKDRGAAMVFQNIALFPHMNVWENISFGLRLRNFNQKEIDDRVNQAAEIVQIEDMLDRMPDEMSGGQRQRVAIARSIVREPDVFLMDEPLANLDAKLRNHMRTEIQRLQKDLETTAIYVTHDQAEAMTMSDRVAVIESGKLQQIAPPLDCYNKPANRFVAGFIGSPSMNFFEGQLGENGFKSEFFDAKFDLSSMDTALIDEVTLGIRPEDVYLTEAADSVSRPTEEIEATVDVLEPMGDKILVYLLLSEESKVDLDDPNADNQLLISIDPASELVEDKTVHVMLDREKIHLFDANSGKALQHGLVKPTQISHQTRAED